MDAQAWAGLPLAVGPVAMPVTDDRRFTGAVAVLLSGAAVLVSLLGLVGGYLAVVIGLGAALTAADSFRCLAGRSPGPARRLPALLGALAVSWSAAATLGGLGVSGVLGSVLAVGAVLAVAWGILSLGRLACRS